MLLDLRNLPASQRQQWLQHAVVPRPIALASTISRSGAPNLAPFSFFNLFSADPPIVIFSPARRVRDNSIKHTLDNLYFVPEVVIHMCDHGMVHQVNLASGEYARDVNEFVKAGFTPVTAHYVRPFRVQEAKIALECAVKEIKPLGKNGGAGNLIIAEVLCMHVDDAIVINKEGTMIDPLRMDYVARLGGDFYTRINLPHYIRQGNIPAKRHTQFRNDAYELFSEQLFSTEGFSNDCSLLYHVHPPTRIIHTGVPRDARLSALTVQPFKHLCFDSFKTPSVDKFLKSRTPLFFNNDCIISVAAPADDFTDNHYQNADADEVIFVHEGSVELHSLYGDISFRHGDYLVIPRSTIYQLSFTYPKNRMFF